MHTDGTLRLRFVAGTLELTGRAAPDADALRARLDAALDAEQRGAWVWDPRAACLRAPARVYAPTRRALAALDEPVEDEARAYPALDGELRVRRSPRPYQREAIEGWKAARCRGVVVLPTGAGKSHVAVMAMAVTGRSTLVVAPTLDLVRQWHGLLRTSFGCEVGVVGGGDHEVLPITVTTYDSAYIHMEHLGARFGLVVFDECHHLPGESYAFAAEQCLAPYRLGLTATPDRADGRDALYETLIGPTVHEQAIVQLAGDYLADYDVERIVVSLTSAEREAYEAHRAIYLGFVRRNGIRMGAPDGWATFLMRTAGSEAGQRALDSYRAQKRLALCAEGKLDVVGDLLDLHRSDRALLFTQDNATAYAISRRFLVPVITHQTRVSERTAILEGLARGRFHAVVTSKVLNEGVDVPSANVAMVISGSGSVREHVQRLGRVLRKQKDKRAVLYELVSGDTSEQSTSDRRREHVAYKSGEEEGADADS